MAEPLTFTKADGTTEVVTDPVLQQQLIQAGAVPSGQSTLPPDATDFERVKAGELGFETGPDGKLLDQSQIDYGLGERVDAGLSFGLLGPDREDPEALARSQAIARERPGTGLAIDAATGLATALPAILTGVGAGAVAGRLGAGAIGQFAARTAVSGAIQGVQSELESTRQTGEKFEATDAALRGMAWELGGEAAGWTIARAAGVTKNVAAKATRAAAAEQVDLLSKGGMLDDYRVASWAPDLEAEVGRRAADAFDTIDDNFNDVAALTKKQGRIAKQVDRLPAEALPKVQAVQGEIGTELRSVRAAIAEDASTAAGVQPPGLRKLDRELVDAGEALAAATRPGEAWKILDDQRRALQGHIDTLEEAFDNQPGHAWLSRAGIDRLKKAEQTVRATLLREDVWGKAAADLQKAYNTPFHEKIYPARKIVNQKFRFAQERLWGGQTKFRGEVGRIVKNLVKPAKGGADKFNQRELLSQWLDGVEDIAKAGFDAAPDKAQAVLDAVKTIRRAPDVGAQIAAAVERTGRRGTAAELLGGAVAGIASGGPLAPVGWAAVRGMRAGQWLSKALGHIGWYKGEKPDLARLFQGAEKYAPPASALDDVLDGVVRPAAKAAPPAPPAPPASAPPIAGDLTIPVGPDLQGRPPAWRPGEGLPPERVAAIDAQAAPAIVPDKIIGIEESGVRPRPPSGSRPAGGGLTPEQFEGMTAALRSGGQHDMADALEVSRQSLARAGLIDDGTTAPRRGKSAPAGQPEPVPLASPEAPAALEKAWGKVAGDIEPLRALFPDATVEDIEALMPVHLFKDLPDAKAGQVVVEAAGEGRVSLALRGIPGVTLSREVFRRPDGALKAYHSTFFLDDAIQGKGLGKQVIGSMFDAYEKLGVKEIELHAAQTGRWLWPSLGFDAAPEAVAQARQGFQQHLVEAAEQARLYADGALTIQPRDIRDLLQNFGRGNALVRQWFNETGAEQLLDQAAWKALVKEFELGPNATLPSVLINDSVPPHRLVSAVNLELLDPADFRAWAGPQLERLESAAMYIDQLHSMPAIAEWEFGKDFLMHNSGAWNDMHLDVNEGDPRWLVAKLRVARAQPDALSGWLAKEREAEAFAQAPTAPLAPAAPPAPTAVNAEAQAYREAAQADGILAAMRVTANDLGLPEGPLPPPAPAAPLSPADRGIVDGVDIETQGDPFAAVVRMGEAVQTLQARRFALAERLAPRRDDYFHEIAGVATGASPGAMFRGKDGVLRYIKASTMGFSYPELVNEAAMGDVVRAMGHDALEYELIALAPEQAEILMAKHVKRYSTPEAFAQAPRPPMALVTKYAGNWKNVQAMTAEELADPRIGEELARLIPTLTTTGNYDALMNAGNVLFDPTAGKVIVLDTGITRPGKVGADMTWTDVKTAAADATAPAALAAHPDLRRPGYALQGLMDAEGETAQQALKNIKPQLLEGIQQVERGLGVTLSEAKREALSPDDLARYEVAQIQRFVDANPFYAKLPKLDRQRYARQLREGLEFARKNVHALAVMLFLQTQGALEDPEAAWGRATEQFRAQRDRLVAGTARALVTSNGDGGRRGPPRATRAGVEARQAEVAAWRQDPTELLTRIEEGLADAPEAVGPAAVATFKALTHLQTKIPQAQRLNAISARKIPVSEAALRTYALHERAALRPAEALSAAKTEGRIAPETLETFTQLYPDLLFELRVAAVQEVQTQGPPQTMQGRLAYSQLFDGDGRVGDPAFAPSVTAAVEAALLEQAEVQRNGPPGNPLTPSKPAGLQKISGA